MIISIRVQLRLWCCVAAALAVSAVSARADQSWMYEIVTETSMPNLEENLRYATTKSNQCLYDAELAHSFSALTHAALQGCELKRDSQLSDAVSYPLTCQDSSGTHGHAIWSITPERKVGTLRVKLGGKNMTFFQRVTARLLGPCE